MTYKELNMKKVLGIIVLIAAVGIGYWLISPLFINKTANDSLDEKTEASVQAAIEQFKMETKDTNIDDQTTGAGKEELFMEMAKMEDEKVEEAMPKTSVTPEKPTSEVKIEKTGNFKAVAHHGEGVAKLINLGEDNGYIIRFENFSVLNGPDLRVLLSKQSNVMNSSDLGDYIELGGLKGNIGTQNYAIPSNIDLNEYISVVIYCKPFSVVFNSANLN